MSGCDQSFCRGFGTLLTPDLWDDLYDRVLTIEHINRMVKLDSFTRESIRYTYGGIVNMKDADTKTIYELMVAAKELEFEELSIKIEIYFIETKAGWIRTHFSFHSNLIFESEDFKSLQGSTLVADVINRIKPYKKIFEEQLWDDLIQYLLLPNQPIKSIILPARSISSSELLSISICELPSRSISISNYMPYKFQLILRGSRDGFVPKTFWDICHGYTNTVVILKIKGTNEILGEYNPIEWNMDRMETKNSFIFSLKNGNIHNSILSRVKNPANALYYYVDDDLTMESEYRKRAYEKPIRTTKERFSIIDYEIFQVIKK
ncbi:hypothetical protein Glove_40g88 [Diversispora epigaea]|uniref:TLDc domain-containing protein n=1 Tax=Diversispora epigaea TaxID=1348612 RepID=A0A397JQI5_9GLOM|nr:hypothetical protein Glove_40g88 [Diversispora epigaea]